MEELTAVRAGVTLCSAALQALTVNLLHCIRDALSTTAVDLTSDVVVVVVVGSSTRFPNKNINAAATEDAPDFTVH